MENDGEYVKDNRKAKIVSISLKNEQYEFIKNSSRNFSLSKFVQHKLDDYIRMIDETNKISNIMNDKKGVILVNG